MTNSHPHRLGDPDGSLAERVVYEVGFWTWVIMWLLYLVAGTILSAIHRGLQCVQSFRDNG